MTGPAAVIGASISGLFTALLLAREGIAVHVFERQEEVDAQPRTLIATSQMRDLLGALGDSAVVNEVRTFELFGDGKVATVPLRHPDLVVERSALIRALAKEAEAAGVSIYPGRRFLGFRAMSHGFEIDLHRGSGQGVDKVGVQTLIGADGASSAVGRAAGWSPQQTAPLLQAIVRLPEDLSCDTSRVWFRPQDTPYFFWLIPESMTHGALGVIGERPQLVRSRLESFLEERGLNALEYQAARIPIYRSWTRVHKAFEGGNVYLVGDAAGQVKVTTVGGLVTGLRGAVGIAEAITTGSRRHLRALRRELDTHLIIRRALHGFNETHYRDLLGLLNNAATRTLGTHSRDEAGRALVRAFLAQPRLVSLIPSLLTTARRL